MYSQLRTQYPTASLTSDLLVAEPSHYVVQAVIKIGESALATGLSAASTVEAAEDQARARALMILGISVHDFSSDVQLIDPPVPGKSGAPAQLNPAAQPSVTASAPHSETWEEDWTWPHEQPKSLIQESAELDMPLESTSPPTPPGLDDLPRPTNGVQSRRKSTAKASEKPPKGRRPHYQETTRPEPIDLSDAIAQSDIELKRLGWSHTEGRRFLEDTYGKRSRQQLTDSELLEFLEYLKVQSLAQDPPF